MKQIIYPGISLLLMTSASAQGMMGYGTGYGWISGLIFFALGAFIFSIIFWLTYKWIVKK
jgi:hypothetical protein